MIGVAKMKKVFGALILLAILPLGSVSAQDGGYAPATQNAQSSADRVLQNAVAGQPISANDVEAFLHWMSVSEEPVGDYERWIPSRSEERRVGKECRSRRWPYHEKK